MEQITILINIYDETVQDQLGENEIVQDQTSINSNGQGAEVVGENIEALQDSVHYTEQTQAGTNGTVQDQSSEMMLFN